MYLSIKMNVALLICDQVVNNMSTQECAQEEAEV